MLILPIRANYLIFTFPAFFENIKLINIMIELTPKKRRIMFLLSVLIFLIVVPFVLLYSYGYRISSDFNLIKTGGLYVSSPVSGSQIFINNELERETNILQAGLFLQSLKPDDYSVIIAKDGYWPWTKKLTVKEQMVTEARALLLPKNPDGKIIIEEQLTPSEKIKYEEIRKLLTETIEEKEENPTIEKLINHDRQKLIWETGENDIFVEWINGEKSRPYYIEEGKHLVLHSLYGIRNVDFYPGRRDVVIFAVQNSIFAIEIDKRGGQALQPIYKGKEPNFVTYKNDMAIYVEEGGGR